MRINAITVCVNYSDLLARSLNLWHTGSDRLIVVTDPSDHATQTLCHKMNVETHVTNIFYRNGAKFNKGAALSEAIIKKDLRHDWMLVFDADIVPPRDWRVQLERLKLAPGRLYGAYRYWQPEQANPLRLDFTKRMPQSWVIGFFTLFHANDPHLQPGPVFDLCWPHAGNFDTIFTRRWHSSEQTILGIPMIHLGEERENWVGRGKKEELKSVLAQRRGAEDWYREKMLHPPTIEGV